MISFFQKVNLELISDAPMSAVDPLSHFQLGGIGDLEPACALMNTAEVPQEGDELKSLSVCDTEYLRRRERFAWAYYRELRPLGSVFSLLYYAVFAVVAIVDLVESESSIPVVASIATGFTTFMFASEVVSLRICQIRSCRPTEPIPYLYPGVEFYFIQYVAVWIGSISLVIAIVLEEFDCGIGVIGLTGQQILALLAPWVCYPCLIKRHRRGDRFFRWVRAGFFNSCWWVLVRVVFFILLTPGIYAIQIIIAGDIRNTAAVAKHPDQASLIEL
jgi:hypothetical protein